MTAIMCDWGSTGGKYQKIWGFGVFKGVNTCEDGEDIVVRSSPSQHLHSSFPFPVRAFAISTILSTIPEDTTRRIGEPHRAHDSPEALVGKIAQIHLGKVECELLKDLEDTWDVREDKNR